jgi:hypothetical protein
VDSEIKRRLAEASSFTLEEAEAFHTGIGKAVRYYVLDPEMTDEDKLTAIEDALEAIARQSGIPPNEAGPE